MNFLKTSNLQTGCSLERKGQFKIEFCDRKILKDLGENLAYNSKKYPPNNTKIIAKPHHTVTGW